MEGFIILLVMVAICGVLMGPVALVIAIIALNRSRELSDQLRGKDIISKWPAQDKLRTRQVPTVQQEVRSGYLLRRLF